MNEIKVVGKQNFMGKEIKQLEGGFGENQRIISAKEVSNIHDIELKVINQSIKRLIDKQRIKANIDYIDMMTDDIFKVTASDLGLITSNGQKNCYVLSERGYTKLIKYMDDDKSWEIMDKLVDEYFKMREIIKSDEQLKKDYLFAIYNGGQDAVIASKKLTEIEVAEATKPLLEDIKTKENIISEKENEINRKQDVIVGLCKDINLEMYGKKPTRSLA